MGAKSAVKLRKRGVAYKCNDCGRKLMTADALVAHQRTAHNIISKRRGRPAESPKALKVDKAFVKEKIEVEIAMPSECTQTTENTNMKKNQVEFECPKCFKRFPTYFPARKHIQKYHCVDRQNVAVPPHHPSLITPVRIEQCTKCMRKVKSIETHLCDDKLEHAGITGNAYSSQLCICAACEEWFPNLNDFDLHVVSIHSEHVESMFFPTSFEFVKWKNEMEHQTKVSYAMLENYSSKRYYHCNVSKDNHYKRPSPNHVCPSTIVVQEFPKGIQVHFYHKHYNHSAIEYKLSQKYNKYSISSFLKRAEDYTSLLQVKSDEDDLYMQFKTLMEGIVVDAAKINIATLKIILGKALEITSILANYDEEELEDAPISDQQIMSDDQIAKALEEPLAKRKMAETTKAMSNTGDLLEVKRRKTDVESNISDLQEKRAKLDEGLKKEENTVGSPKIINAFSLADSIKRCKPVKGKSLAEKVDDEPKVELDDEKKAKVNGEPSSFNDSYKDFVVKNFPHMESIASRTRSKPAFKTRIGQFVPNSTKIVEKTKTQPVTTKVDEVTKPVSVKLVKNTKSLSNASENLEPIWVSGKILEEKTISNTTSTKTVEDKPKTVTFSTKTVEDKPKTVTFSTKIIEDNTKVLPKIDVKIGTDLKETPNTRSKPQVAKVTPKAKMITRVNSRASFDKPKVDIKYEVKEREDDCNILILKI